ncbi:MAG: protein kinase [Planctomycetia bacterium]|nr:protein kinase [Planctomycetia bacterium]
MSTSVADFIDTLRNSRLLEPGRLDELLGTPEAKEVDAPTLAQCLVQLGWLTTYQVDQLFQGRGQGLHLAGFRVQDQLPNSPDGSALRARHPDKDGRFVLKVLPRDRLASPLKAQRLREEVKLAAQLAHPNIARAVGVEAIGDEHIYIREYVEGVSLAQLVEESGPVTAERAGDYLLQAAQGLQEAHARGLAHGRLRPSALLVVHTPSLVGTANHDTAPAGAPPAGAVLKIADFGLAVLADEPSPRQDLRDLGAIAVLLLFGREPSDNAAATITPQWQDILRNLLTEEPGAGYQSAADLIAALNGPADSPARAPAAPPVEEPLLAAPVEAVQEAAPVEEAPPAPTMPDTFPTAQADTIDEPLATGDMPPLAEPAALTTAPPSPFSAPAPAYHEEPPAYAPSGVAEPELQRPAAPPRKRKYDAKFWLLFSIGLLLHLVFCGGITLLIIKQFEDDAPPTNKVKFKTVRPATRAQ